MGEPGHPSPHPGVQELEEEPQPQDQGAESTPCVNVLLASLFTPTSARSWASMSTPAAA